MLKMANYGDAIRFIASAWQTAFLCCACHVFVAGLLMSEFLKIGVG